MGLRTVDVYLTQSVHGYAFVRFLPLSERRSKVISFVGGGGGAEVADKFESNELLNGTIKSKGMIQYCSRT